MAFFPNKIQTVTSTTTVENLQHLDQAKAHLAPGFAGVSDFHCPGSPERCLEDFCTIFGPAAPFRRPARPGPCRWRKRLHAACNFHTCEQHHAPHLHRARRFPDSADCQNRHISPLLNTKPKARCPPTNCGMAGCFSYFCYNQMTNS